MLAQLAVLLLLALQDAPPETTVGAGNVLVRVPNGWKHEETPEGLFLRPGDLREDEAFVVIFSPGGKADGSLPEQFEKSWKQAAGSRKVISKAPERDLKTDGGTAGLMSVGLFALGEDARLITTLAVFKPGDRFEAVIAMTAQDKVFQRYSETLRDILKSLRFRNVELPVPYELLLASPPGAAPSFRCLFQDGSMLTELPPEGMDGFDVQEARTRLPKAWGKHETAGGVRMLRIGDRVETPAAAQVQGIESSTGLKIEGKFIVVAQEFGSKAAGLLFHADGTFVDGGGTLVVVPAVPGEKERDRGTYAIARNTLTLTFADGRTLRVLFAALPKGTPDQLLIGKTWFKRS